MTTVNVDALTIEARARALRAAFFRDMVLSLFGRFRGPAGRATATRTASA